MKTGNYKTGNEMPTNKCSNIHDSSVTENRQWEMTFCTSASENLSIVRRQVHTRTGGLQFAKEEKSSINTSLL